MVAVEACQKCGVNPVLSVGFDGMTFSYHCPCCKISSKFTAYTIEDARKNWNGLMKKL